MAYLVVCGAALLASALTFFSGFGLGTLLLPAFALFFPPEIAVAATAVVHLANNLFKGALVGRRADWGSALRFIFPAVVTAAIGAALLNRVAHLPPLAEYTLGGKICSITPVKAVIAALLAGFAFLELSPRFKDLAFDPKWLPLGGALSGFFGGLSGQQGALRGAFLVRAGLSKEAFVGTSVVCAIAVDFSRLFVYGAGFFGGQHPLVIAGILAACAGSMLGARLLPKVTMRTVQLLVGWMLVLIALGLGAGIL